MAQRGLWHGPARGWKEGMLPRMGCRPRIRGLSGSEVLGLQRSLRVREKINLSLRFG